MNEITFNSDRLLIFNIYHFLWDIKLLFLKLIDNITKLNKDNNFDSNDNIYTSKQHVDTENALKKYGNSILRVGISYLKNMVDAEDILQETLIKHLSKAPKFESDDHEKAWLIRVAVNLCKNKLKSQKKRDYIELDENLVTTHEDDVNFVWEAVNSLSVKYREVIHLFYHEGYTTAQIADILDKKDVTVRSLLHRGRNELKIILQEVYDFEE